MEEHFQLGGEGEKRQTDERAGEVRLQEGGTDTLHLRPLREADHHPDRAEEPLCRQLPGKVRVNKHDHPEGLQGQEIPQNYIGAHQPLNTEMILIQSIKSAAKI